ncbi:MAG TPA: hypothetical protein VEY88_23025 [Archangium sp.]|nr:hypothetical protein [Archangium sp.]
MSLTSRSQRTWRRSGRASNVAVVITLLCSAASSADTVTDSRPVFVRVEGHGSLLSDAANRSILSGAYGAAVAAGARTGRWGFFGQVELNQWSNLEVSGAPVQGVLNVGAGAELRVAEDFIRSSITVGPSILLHDTPLDRAGHVGVFIDIRPAAFRWRLTPRWLVSLDPLSFVLVAPVLGGIPLIQPQYRSTLGVEFSL